MLLLMSLVTMMVESLLLSHVVEPAPPAAVEWQKLVELVEVDVEQLALMLKMLSLRSSSLK